MAIPPGAAVQHFGAPLLEARLVVVLLHGRDQDPAYMNEHVVRRIGDPSVAWVAPAAPDRTWYPKSFLAPLDENQPWLGQAESRLDELGTELEESGFAAERVLWCGFSQGACLACHQLARSPRRWAGLVAFTGGLIGPPGTAFDVADGFEQMPVYLSSGDADAWVPVERVRETAAAFNAAGARVTLEVVADRDHEISDIEIEHAHSLFSPMQ